MYDHKDKIDERHRHRYEINPKYVTDLQSKGLKFVGRDDTGERMEIFELIHDPVTQWVEKDGVLKPKSGHPYYVGCQFHPEYLTRPLKPSPPFLGLILAAANLLPTYLAAKEKNLLHEFHSSHSGLGEYGSDKGSDTSSKEEATTPNKDPYTIHPIRGTQMEVIPPN